MDHVSADLGILVSVDDIPKAVKLLIRRDFEVAASELYTVSLTRRGFIVDLYINPLFTWIIYSDGEKLLKESSEEIMINTARAKA